MAYYIRYDSGKRKKLRRSAGGKSIALLLFSAALLLGVQWLLTSEISLLELLIPGQSQVTLPAIESLADALAAGEDVGEAVTAFCQQIFTGAVG